MSDYPQTITADMLPQWADISDAEVERDIADTELEIEGFRTLVTGYGLIAEHHHSEAERRLAEFKRGAYPKDVTDREAFVAFLKRLRAARTDAALLEVPS